MKKSAYWIWDPGPAINIPDHIFKSLVTIICIKNAQFPCYRSGSWIRCLFNPGMEKLGFGIWDEQWYRNWHFFSPLYFEFEIEIVLGIPSFNRWKNLTCLISSESGTLPLVFQIQNLLMCIRSVSYSRLHIIKLVRSGHFLCVLTFYRNLANFKRGRFLTVPGTYRLRKVESGSQDLQVMGTTVPCMDPKPYPEPWKVFEQLRPYGCKSGALLAISDLLQLT